MCTTIFLINGWNEISFKWNRIYEKSQICPLLLSRSHLAYPSYFSVSFFIRHRFPSSRPLCPSSPVVTHDTAITGGHHLQKSSSAAPNSNPQAPSLTSKTFDVLPLPLYLTNTIFFMLFFSITYYSSSVNFSSPSREERRTEEKCEYLLTQPKENIKFEIEISWKEMLNLK